MKAVTWATGEGQRASARPRGMPSEVPGGGGVPAVRTSLERTPFVRAGGSQQRHLRNSCSALGLLMGTSRPAGTLPRRVCLSGVFAANCISAFGSSCHPPGSRPSMPLLP